MMQNLMRAYNTCFMCVCNTPHISKHHCHSKASHYVAWQSGEHTSIRMRPLQIMLFVFHCRCHYPACRAPSSISAIWRGSDLFFSKVVTFSIQKSLPVPPKDLRMDLIFILLLASTKALPVKEAFKDDIDQELVIGSSCALGAQQANGSYNLDQIEECGYCWEGVGELEEIQQAEICIEKCFPEIGAACESVLSKTDTENIIREVFTCF